MAKFCYNSLINPFLPQPSKLIGDLVCWSVGPLVCGHPVRKCGNAHLHPCPLVRNWKFSGLNQLLTCNSTGCFVGQSVHPSTLHLLPELRAFFAQLTLPNCLGPGAMYLALFG